MDNELIALAERLGQVLTAGGKKITTAESCTGGWIAQTITAVAGSSAWFERGFVTYSNDAKIQMLAVKPTTLERYGAVSAETVKEMAIGALRFSLADCSIAVSGIAGPEGDSEHKPVGTVYLAWCQQGKQPVVGKYLFPGDRHAVRSQAVKCALQEACKAFATS